MAGVLLRPNNQFHLSCILAVATVLLAGVISDAAPRRQDPVPPPELIDLIVYRRNECPACDNLEAYLRDTHVPYRVKNLSLDPEASESLHQMCLERHLTCHDYPLILADGVMYERGPLMVERLLDWGHGNPTDWRLGILGHQDAKPKLRDPGPSSVIYVR